MRSTKRYTNTTFTRRVDHDGGRHRPSRAGKEPVVCAGCGAIYARRRWSHAPAASIRAAAANRPVSVAFCPGCRRRTSGLPRGFVHLDGGFVALHREEISRMLHNEAAHALEDNPTAMVLNWGDDGAGTMLITTSTEHLAFRLGRALEKAYDGTLHCGFSHENKLAHVWWHRDAPAGAAGSNAA
jgi:NMD protein affecting ribosome stability and mRNA decay